MLAKILTAGLTAISLHMAQPSYAKDATNYAAAMGTPSFAQNTTTYQSGIERQIQNVAVIAESKGKESKYRELFKNAKFTRWSTTNMHGVLTRGELETTITGNFGEEYIVKGKPSYMIEFYTTGSKNDFDIAIKYGIKKRNREYEKTLVPLSVVLFLGEKAVQFQYLYQEQGLVKTKTFTPAETKRQRIGYEMQFLRSHKLTEIKFPEKPPAFSKHNFLQMLSNAYWLIKTQPDATHRIQTSSQKGTQAENELMFNLEGTTNIGSCSWDVIVYTTESATPDSKKNEVRVDKVLYSRNEFLRRFGEDGLNSDIFEAIPKEVKDKTGYIGIEIDRQTIGALMTHPKHKVEKREFCVEL